MNSPGLPACVGLIGDVHAEDELLEAALKYLQTKNAEVVLCTGDVADGAGSVARCCELLRQHNVQTVRGNHDRWLLTAVMRDLPEATDEKTLSGEVLEYLANLSVTREFSSSLGGVLLCHGLGLHDMARVEPDHFGYALESNIELQALMRNSNCRFVFNGHTHYPMVRHFAGLTVINAGTLQRKHDPGFLMVHFDYDQVQLLRFGKSNEIILQSTERLVPCTSI